MSAGQAPLVGSRSLRVVVLGGAGNFGARIVRALQNDANIELIAASRTGREVPGAAGVVTTLLDIHAAGFSDHLKALRPGLVIHCVGPFQGQNYQVVQAALAAGAHYLDLADGRDFVAGFALANDAAARRANRSAISGASTLPAISSAVLDEIMPCMDPAEEVEVCIAPGQRAARGVATLEAVFSYLGKPVSVWEAGVWRQRVGWMDLRRVPLDIGTRWAALCDVPDLQLLPQRYPQVRSVRFHAALELGVQHLTLWLLAACRRIGLPFPVQRWAVALNGVAGWLDAFGGDWGGMRVSVVGKARGLRVRHSWQLAVPAQDGPEIPCLAAILLAQQIAAGKAPPVGAMPCMGLLALADFQPMFDRWSIRTRMLEESL